MNWSKPSFSESRFGFEVTMYVSLKTTTQIELQAPKLYLRSSTRVLSWLRRCLILLPLALVTVPTEAATSWPISGANIENTHYVQDPFISKGNVKNLKLKWTYQTTAADLDPYVFNGGQVSATPAVEGDYIYFTDFIGHLFKNRRSDGSNVWTKNFVTDLSLPGKVITQSRSTPFIMGDMLIVGGNFWANVESCPAVGAEIGEAPPTPATRTCTSGDGAIVIAVNKNDGSLIWSTKVDDHIAAKITGSVSGVNGNIYLGLGNWEEAWSEFSTYVVKLPDGTFVTDPTLPYPCCSFRGAVVALNSQGQILWKTYLTPGFDEENKLSPARHALLNTPGGIDNIAHGFHGVSAYGHSPTIDLKRRQIYVATSENSTAPGAAELCEKYRRYKTGLRPDLYPAIPNPDDSVSFKAANVTCATLNEKLGNYQSAMLALDMDTGKIKWAFYSSQYDAWNEACDPPDSHVSTENQLVSVPQPLAATVNCFQNPIGPDYGFGNNPLLIKDVKVSQGKRDLVVAGNKDGRIFALNPDNGQKIWETSIEPGGLVGGVQWGMASDGTSIFTGSANSSNVGRDFNKPIITAEQFVAADGYNLLNPPLRWGLNSKPGAPSDLLEWAGPGDTQALPQYFPRGVTPGTLEITGYPPTDRGDGYLGWHGTPSGPREKHEVINMPSDVVPDGINVWTEGGKVKTIVGMVHSIDAGTGKINWQRPAIDSTRGSLNPFNSVYASVTATKGLIFVGYWDGKGTLVALDAKDGKKRFQYNLQATFLDRVTGQIVTENIGMNEAGPAIVDGVVYWGLGVSTATSNIFPFAPEAAPNKRLGRVNKVLSFELPKGSMEGDDN